MILDLRDLTNILILYTCPTNTLYQTRPIECVFIIDNYKLVLLKSDVLCKTPKLLCARCA